MAAVVGAGLERAVHSDFIVHWTGRDIDKEEGERWHKADHRSLTSEAANHRYLERLRSILEHGLWLTEEASKVGDTRVPPIARCCFTELRLSDSRRHARRYGRLAIGVKRPFLFRRGGRPLAYVGYRNGNTDPFFQACRAHLKDQRMLNFFKPMNEKKRAIEL